MHYVSSSHAERSAAFDEFMGTTGYALEQLQPGYVDPSVLRYKAVLLGNLAHAFLPNFDHGVAKLPPSKRDNEGVAVIPFKKDEKVLSDISLRYPTWRRVAKTATRYGVSEGRVVQASMQLISSGSEHSTPLELKGKSYMALAATVGRVGDLVVAGRGIMHIRPNDERTPALLYGCAGAHEMLHDEQFTSEYWKVAALDSPEGLHTAAAMELPAYHLSAGILGHAGLQAYAGDVLTQSIIKVEDMRGQEDMFNPSPELVASLHRARYIGPQH